MTSKQYHTILRRQYQQELSGATKPGSSTRTRSKALAIKERDIQATCTEWLVLDGWRPLRTEFCYDAEKGRTVGEEGMPDYLYLRPSSYRMLDRAASDAAVWACTDVMWIEWKSLTGKAAVHQKLWHAAERARGALVLVAGDGLNGFPASIYGFQRWYRDSGLMRKRI